MSDRRADRLSPRRPHVTRCHRAERTGGLRADLSARVPRPHLAFRTPLANRKQATRGLKKTAPSALPIIGDQRLIVNY